MTDQPDFDWDKAITLAKQDELRHHKWELQQAQARAREARADKINDAFVAVAEVVWVLRRQL